ncbi:DNA polymerase I [candidate division KSB1 bacterium]|nr:DNA polymerase I [candidate division KSB1 bacterium]
MKRLFLIDGSALVYRSYYAFVRNPLINSRGENVSAVFGFTQTMLNIMDNEKPDYFAVIFDTPEPTFRHKLFPEYKAQRAAPPEDMIEQLPRILEMLEVLEIPNISLPGYEADDIMGTFARRAERDGIQTVLVTGDKDFMQLVTPKTIIYNPKRSGQEPEWLDEKGVQDKIGLPPALIIDYLGLMGDSSDNIPGVPNIGPKTALSLLQEYGSLEKVLENAKNVTNKRARENLAAYTDQAHLSKKLATIHCDVPVRQKPLDLLPGQVDKNKAFDFFQRMEFRTLSKRFAPEEEKVDTRYHLVNTPEKFSQFKKQLEPVFECAFDTETTDLDPLRAQLVGLSFSWKTGEAYYIPVKGPDDLTGKTPVLKTSDVLAALKPFFENPKIKKCAQNAKYDILVLQQHGITVQGLFFDTMLASYLVNPIIRQHNLDSLALSYFNIKKIPTSSLLGSGKNQKTMDQVQVEQVCQYACEDAEVTWRLRDAIAPKLQKLKLQSLFETVEIPLVEVLCGMESAGVALDELFLAKMSQELGVDMKKLELKIYKLAGGKFNINSPKQLGAVLFEKMGLPPVRKTKTGYSTDVSVLEELARQHELPAQILDFRQLMKLKSTYVDALPRLVNPKTGKVHTSYNQTVTATGRLSSSDPNLQNIPIRTTLGRQIRRAFIPSSTDFVLLDADYSQIELRIMAHLSKDETLLASFLHDEDVHRRTAALVFEKEPDEVTSDERRKAKEVNFGIMYGMGAYGLSQRLGITPEEGAAFIESYFANYPGVQEFMLRIVQEARKNGFVTTLLNRRRYLPEIKSDNRRMREFAERTAINTPIQGSAADLIKVAMVNIDQQIKKRNLVSKMILQVHDELVFDVHKNELDVMKNLVKKEMEGALELSVPIKADMGMGENWLEAH